MKLARLVASKLNEKNLSIATAESCTGGMIASELVNIPGVSNHFFEGYVTYSEEAKVRLLGVSEDTLKKHSVYSAECAREMAYGVMKKASADIGVATTGIAGPDGGSEEFPVGLVYIAVCYKGKITTRKYIFSGDRYQIRFAACKMAFRLILDVLG